MFILAYLVIVIGGSLLLYAVKGGGCAAGCSTGRFSRGPSCWATTCLLIAAMLVVLLGTLLPLKTAGAGQHLDRRAVLQHHVPGWWRRWRCCWASARWCAGAAIGRAAVAPPRRGAVGDAGAVDSAAVAAAGHRWHDGGGPDHGAVVIILTLMELHERAPTVTVSGAACGGCPAATGAWCSTSAWR
ncbi:hypothetical protein M8494_03800 [Serratia ureilytica]